MTLVRKRWLNWLTVSPYSKPWQSNPDQNILDNLSTFPTALLWKKPPQSLKRCLSPNSHHYILHPMSVIFCVYFWWKTSDADSSASGFTAPPERFFFCVVSLVTLKSLQRRIAELCTLRFVGVFSGLACFVFNRTDWFSPEYKITASKQSVHFGPLHWN